MMYCIIYPLTGNSGFLSPLALRSAHSGQFSVPRRMSRRCCNENNQFTKKLIKGLVKKYGGEGRGAVKHLEI